MTGTQVPIGLSRDEMAQRAALDIPDGSYVNLGIGIPERVAGYIPRGREVSITRRTVSLAWGLRLRLEAAIPS